jgi:O-antigen ligase
MTAQGGQANSSSFSESSRARLEQTAALLAAVLLIVPLALAGGGYELTDRHIVGLVVWLAVVALLVLGAASRSRVGPPLYWSAGLILALAILSALSSLWSGSMELSVIEADRVLVYLGFFLAAFLVAQTDLRRRGFAEGLVIALTLVVLLGTFSRLLPHVFNVSGALGSGPRLQYPLGYWNAVAAVAGISAVMLLWTSREAAWAWLRWASVAAIPAVLLGLYFTYSRGGIVALVVAGTVLLALSHDRLWMLATLAIGAIGALPAVLAVQARNSLAENLDLQATVDQGVVVLLYLLGGILLALALFALLRRLEARGGQKTSRAVELSRHPKMLRGIVAAICVVGIGLAVAVGGRAWDQFSSSDIQFPNNPSQHFSTLNGAGRHDFWRVAIENFDEDPVLGKGAGTYRFAWLKDRSIEMPVHDAHSLYLESFEELGVVGGLTVLGLVGFLLWCGFAAWRDAPRPRREAYAALLAAMAAFAVGAAVDWFWEIADVAAIFFLAAGVLVSVRCAQIAPGRTAPGAEQRRWGLAVGGLALGWISAVALIGPLLVERELDQSKDAAAAGDIDSATQHASTARSIEPWAASPYVQLGGLADLQQNYPNAIVHFTHAIEREDQNWQWYYLRAQADQAAGDEAAMRADLSKARELNPLPQCLRETGFTC